MAKPNYSFEKRRKEMERKNKKQQKAERKQVKAEPLPASDSPEAEAAPV
jgi:hypothetical protein